MRRVADREPILVAGAGALGSVVGGLLAASGWPVTLLGRRAHLEEVGARGLLIDGLFGTHRVRGIECVTDVSELRGRYAAILLTVKTYDTAAMAAAVAPFLAPDGFMVSLQNGLGNVEAAERVLGAGRVLGARVIFGSELVAPGHARVTVYADPVLIGSLDGSGAAAERWAVALAAAGIPAEPTGALLGARYGELAAQPDTRAIMDTVIEEAFSVARAEDVALRWPDAIAYRAAFYGRLVPSTAEHRSSMLQDIERGRPTEIDAMNGYIAARGAARGVPAPVNATLTRLVRARTGRA